MLQRKGLRYWICQGIVHMFRKLSLHPSDGFHSTDKQSRTLDGLPGQIDRVGRGSGMDFTHGTEFTVG